MKVFVNWSTAHRNTAILAGCGLIVITMVVLGARFIRSDFGHLTAYQKLLSSCEVSLTKSQLQYYRIADPASDFEKEVLLPLNRVISNLEVAFTGMENYPEPDEDTKAVLKVVLYDVQQVVFVINQQWQSGEINKSEADTVYEQALQSLGKLSNHISNHSAAIQQRTWFITILTFGFLIGGFMVAMILYFRFHRNKEALITSGKTRLEEEVSRVETLSRFIEAISNDDYSITIENDDKAGLSGRLMAMRDKLKANADEDARRSWSTTGVAQIGEILRDTGSSGLLFDKLIKFVVNYTGCNQGGLFLLNDDEENNSFLELAAAYAFERKKFITKRVEIGQGMVGQCYLEADRIFLAKLPGEYVHITSGLGGANPTCLLLVPLKANEKVYGVLELASFKRLEEHKIQLVEKFAESIASTVSTVKVNESTRMLLERTQQQAEEMRAQEEEMRQNMEELSATQEEMARKEREYIRRIQELEEQAHTRVPAG